MAQGPLRVLHAIEAPLWTGAVEQTLETVVGLRERGHAVTLATTPGSILWHRARDRGLDVVGVELRAELNPAAALRLASVVLRRRAEIIHAHRAHAHTIGLIAAWVTRRPFVVSRHTALRPKDGPWSRLKYTSPAVTRIVAVSNAVADVLVDYGVSRERIAVIHDGVDPERMRRGVDGARVRVDLAIPAGARTVGMIANAYGPSKGHGTFLAAARAVLDALPGTRFVLVGERTDSEEMRSAVGEAGLAGAAMLAGYRSDIPDVLAALDVVVNCPREREGLSVALLESLAAGRPVVATRVGGIPEAVRDGETGLLVPPDGAPALAAAVVRLLTDSTLAARLAAEGARFVRERLTVGRMVESTEALYREILDARRS